MEKRKRVLIIEDYPLLRIGIRALLSQEADMEIAGEADDGRDAALLVEIFAADLVMMDLSLPGMNGIEAIAAIKQRHPNTPVLVFTMHKASEYVRESLLAGADGYVLKDDAHNELRTAIRSVLSGRKYLSSGISAARSRLEAVNPSGNGKGHNIHVAQHALDRR